MLMFSRLKEIDFPMGMCVDTYHIAIYIFFGHVYCIMHTVSDKHALSPYDERARLAHFS